MTIDLDPLRSFCQEHALPWDNARAENFTRYVELLEKFNRAMNLIGPMSTDDVVRELILDSIIPASCALSWDGPLSLLDIGTGAGLPGIPLKLLFPELKLTLVEPRRKRVTFLNIVVKRLELQDVSIHEERIEDLDFAPHDLLISKAFQPPLQWIETASGLVKHPGGHVLCMTRRGELQALEDVASGLCLELVDVKAPEHATRDGVDDRIVAAFRALAQTDKEA
ncbi:MAG: 16S rRNA (guanine(527)-N(7))-methyltransferase RsmG [Myxococcota bacterium]|nr:16S rRNA (guanine(527)-N(7))-methyltransferase RsmG [Myxococcota bacterium]MEC9440122.1 16S rRNA (guanine(527)-N(7))-methyltransferase RsmG [Myxococcota bacterium]